MIGMEADVLREFDLRHEADCQQQVPRPLLPFRKAVICVAKMVQTLWTWLFSD